MVKKKKKDEGTILSKLYKWIESIDEIDFF